MSLESCASVSEDLARQQLIFKDYLPPEAVAARIDAIDAAAVARVGERLWQSGPLTLTALGPLPRDLETAASRIPSLG
jgi:predicted Zn-dependent peptidase